MATSLETRSSHAPWGSIIQDLHWVLLCNLTYSFFFSLSDGKYNALSRFTQQGSICKGRLGYILLQYLEIPNNSEHFLALKSEFPVWANVSYLSISLPGFSNAVRHNYSYCTARVNHVLTHSPNSMKPGELSSFFFFLEERNKYLGDGTPDYH